MYVNLSGLVWWLWCEQDDALQTRLILICTCVCVCLCCALLRADQNQNV